MESFLDRYNYLKIGSIVGQDTFGFDRWINQSFYRSSEWKRMRQHCIARDLGCDLGMLGREIYGDIYVHHMNPMTKDQLVHGEESVLDPEFLICVSLNTHNAIHYGTAETLPQDPIERQPGDTRLW